MRKIASNPTILNINLTSKISLVLLLSLFLLSCGTEAKKNEKSNTNLSTASDTNPVLNFTLSNSKKNSDITTKPKYGNSISEETEDKSVEIVDSVSDTSQAKYLQINKKVYHNVHDDIAFSKFFLKHNDVEILILGKSPIKSVAAKDRQILAFSAKAYSKKASYTGLVNAKIENFGKTTFYEGGAPSKDTVYSKVISFADSKPVRKAGTFKLTFDSATKISIKLDGITFDETFDETEKLAYRLPERTTVPKNSKDKFIKAFDIQYKNSSTTQYTNVDTFTKFVPKPFKETNVADDGHYLNRQGAKLRANQTYIPDSFKDGLTLVVEQSITIKDHPSYFFNAGSSFLALDGAGGSGHMAFLLSFIKQYYGEGVEIAEYPHTTIASTEGFDQFATQLTLALVTNKITLGE